MKVRATEEFKIWLESLRDRQGRSRILSRLFRLADGNPGNSRSVGHGIVELKIDFGPGYRVYYIQRGEVIVLLLCGGDKSSQAKDIERARSLANQQIDMEEDDDGSKDFSF
jgi:putative addiction module killer protein